MIPLPVLKIQWVDPAGRRRRVNAFSKSTPPLSAKPQAEIKKRLKLLSDTLTNRAARRIYRAALRKAGRFMAAAIKQSIVNQGHVVTGLMHNHVRVWTPNQKKYRDIEWLKVELSGPFAFQSRFLEYGTKTGITASHFIEKAWQRSNGTALEIFFAEMDRLIEKELRKVAP